MRKICHDRKLKPKFSLASYAVGFKNKFWTNGSILKIKFLEGNDHQKSEVLKYCVNWCRFANLKFEVVTDGYSDIRITFDPSLGAWSYVGTDNTGIPQHEATMNLGWIDQSVIEHEFGHAIGLTHEHQNPSGGIKWNRDEVHADLSGPPNNWDAETIEHNVLHAYSQNDVIGTILDPKSIMMYPIPKEWTLNGFSVGFNNSISEMDAAFIGKIYPFNSTPSKQCKLKMWWKNLWK